MKKNIVALAVAAAISAPVAMAGAPTVYGKLNMAIQSDAKNATDGTTVDSVASRFGIKGSEDLGNGLKAVYKIEFGLDLAGVDGVTARNQYVGLKGGFGTVLMGSHDTPLKMIQPSDLFNDGVSDNSKVIKSSNKGGEERKDNVIAYVSPSFSGVKIIAAGVSGAAGNASETTLTDVTSIAIAYGSKKKGLYLAAAQNSASGVDAVTRLAAQYKANGLVVNAMTNNQGGKKAIAFNAGYKMGKMMPKVKWSDNSGDVDGTYTSVGLDYSLGKKTKAYIDLLSRDSAAGDFSTTTVGLIHKF